MADFIITVEEARKPLAVQVKVHESTAALRMAASKYDKQWNKRRWKPGQFNDTLGICHRFHSSETPVCAIVRLAPPHIGAGVVAHEMAHATVQLWEVQNKFEDVPITDENDEWFCLVLGELVRQTTIQLIERKIY